MTTYIVNLTTVDGMEEEHEFTTMEEAQAVMDVWGKDDFFTAVWMESYTYGKGC